MSDSKLFLLIGAFICALIGAYIAVMAGVGIFTQPIRSWHELFIAGYLVIYALLAFVPFCAFVYPRFRTSRRSVFVGAAVIEVLVLAFFIVLCIPHI
jgi:integral membrane sensor domain MASE1